ncbi:MAG: AAA family ATPase [Candidatus Bathyarchaeia archaeon]
MSWRCLKPYDHNKNIEDTKWLVNGMIPQFAFIPVISKSGVGKSLFVEWMAECITHGADFMNMHTIPSSVLLIDQDTPVNTLDRRLQEFNRALKSPEICDLYVESYKGYNLADGSLFNAIKNCPACLVIIDSFHSISGTLDPNSTKDMAIISDLKQAIVSQEKTLIITHHVSTHSLLTVDEMMSTENISSLSMGSSTIIEQADEFFVLGSKSADNLKKLYVRPVQKRIPLDIKPFIAVLKENKANKTMEFTFGEYYNSHMIQPEYGIDKDILLVLEQEYGNSPVGVPVLFWKMNERHSMTAIRASISRLVEYGKVIEHKDKPRRFTYEYKPTAVDKNLLKQKLAWIK